MNFNTVMSFGKDYFKNGLVGSLIYIVILFIIRGFVKKYLFKFINKLIKVNENKKTIYNFTKSILSVAIDIVVFSLMLLEINALSSLGTAIVGASSAFAVIIGFAAQESTANFIGGFFLSVFQPFKIGDLIKVSSINVTGIVQNITIRHTVLKTFNNTQLVVPNSIMNAATIENLNADEFYTNYIVYSVAYGSDYQKAMDILKQLANKNDLVINKNQISVSVYKLNDFSVDIRLTVQTTNFSNGFALNLALNKEVLYEFDKANIQIPFPSQTIYQKTSS